MNKNNISAFGLSDQFVALSKEYPELEIGRILSQEKGRYRLICENGEKFAKMAGTFRYKAIAVSEFPAVGDFVMMENLDVNSDAVIHHVLQRDSVLIRKASGTSNKEQVVAANIDIIFLCMSLNNDYNLRRLERYLSICRESGASAVVVLTKADLCEDISEKLAEVNAVVMGADVLVTSAETQNGHEQILPYIKKGSTIALIGSSGVGKSTLINCLLGEDLISTNAILKDDKGQHTTTRREMMLLPNGGLIIDTPGMRELGMWDAVEGVDKTFTDIEELSIQCRYSNCTHVSEPDCAIKNAIESGALSEERWQSYQKLKAENANTKNAKVNVIVKEHKQKSAQKAKKYPKKIRNYDGEEY